ncbi:hypothetical protein [Dactylosporangium fulvum]|uniref:hypothetical protein n=1 Tax=Dactylosporangium fulvum TaxID=53359 RepID=UPI003873218B
MTTSNGFASQAPLYVRVLRLRHLHIGGFVSFLLFECMIAAGVLLALAEFVSWWAVPVLPAIVAVMVKVNDMVIGSSRRARTQTRSAARDSSDRVSSARVDSADRTGEGASAPRRTATALDRAEIARASRGSVATRVGSSGGTDTGTATRTATRPPVAAEPPAQRKKVGVIRITVPARDGGARTAEASGSGSQSTPDYGISPGAEPPYEAPYEAPAEDVAAQHAEVPAQHAADDHDDRTAEVAWGNQAATGNQAAWGEETGAWGDQAAWSAPAAGGTPANWGDETAWGDREAWGDQSTWRAQAAHADDDNLRYERSSLDWDDDTGWTNQAAWGQHSGWGSQSGWDTSQGAYASAEGSYGSMYAQTDPEQVAREHVARGEAYRSEQVGQHGYHSGQHYGGGQSRDDRYGQGQFGGGQFGDGQFRDGQFRDGGDGEGERAYNREAASGGGRHAKQQSVGRRRADDTTDNFSSGHFTPGRHAERQWRTDDDLARQRTGGINQGRFA